MKPAHWPHFKKLSIRHSMSFERSVRIFRWLIIISLAGWLSACVPMKETFYNPSAEGGEIMGSICRGKAGAQNAIEFQHPEVRIDIFSSWERPGIEVHFSMPEGVSLSVPATQFHITTKEKRERLTLSKLTPVSGFF